MFQFQTQPYASDALEDAMRLAQTKALNSYSFSDCINYLNYAWMDMYQRLALIDEGYYSTTVRLNTNMTRLPPFVKNSIRVYAAQDPVGFNRDIFRSSGMNDLRSRSTYHISGFDLYCPDATKRTVWLNFVPIAPMLFFPRNNRDPKIYEHKTAVVQTGVNAHNQPIMTELEVDPNGVPWRVEENDYDLYTLDRSQNALILRHKNQLLNQQYDLEQMIRRDSDWIIHYISCDYPYIFVTYQNRFTLKYESGFYRDILTSRDFIRFNPFEFTGRDSNVEYLRCKWNDKTGLGVVIRDHNDWDDKYYAQHGERIFRIKELGWTPDTSLVYPCPEMYRYLVARLADKFAAFNESSMMGVSKELTEAKYAFEAFCERDKSAWKRIDNVNGPYISDWL